MLDERLGVVVEANSDCLKTLASHEGIAIVATLSKDLTLTVQLPEYNQINEKTP